MNTDVSHAHRHGAHIETVTQPCAEGDGRKPPPARAPLAGRGSRATAGPVHTQTTSRHMNPSRTSCSRSRNIDVLVCSGRHGGHSAVSPRLRRHRPGSPHRVDTIGSQHLWSASDRGSCEPGFEHLSTNVDYRPSTRSNCGSAARRMGVSSHAASSYASVAGASGVGWSRVGSLVTHAVPRRRIFPTRAALLDTSTTTTIASHGLLAGRDPRAGRDRIPRRTTGDRRDPLYNGHRSVGNRRRGGEQA